MKTKSILMIMFLAISTIFVACEVAKEEESSKGSDSSSFTNKMTLGSSYDTTTKAIKGVGVDFTRSTTPQIYFKLESKDDQKGSSLRIKVTKRDGTEAITNTPEVLTNTHVNISFFTTPAVDSAYTVKGYLVKNSVESLIATTTINIK